MRKISISLSTQKKRHASSTRECNLHSIKDSSLKRHGSCNHLRSKEEVWCIFLLTYGHKNTRSLRQQYSHVPFFPRFINPNSIDVFLCGFLKRENPKVPWCAFESKAEIVCIYCSCSKGVLHESQWFVFLCIRIKFWYLKDSEELALPLGKITNSKSLSYIFLKTGGKIWTYMVLESQSRFYFL